ncbi:ketopantoate reductase family protein [Chryseobacterium sp. JV274]|uniref:ketopantoate reductase family protein n=1 Tax=Chryseobacterium sp. JV274 TaxID=1932669 RepID=UPI0015C27857|nr:2-dehydropantoate 2-reductase N-terminal domain-containing protein [Chryseobacterium sp. JV274]CAD0218224.1 Ketopantoate reductase [Chryseobacterium sp. JV274]
MKILMFGRGVINTQYGWALEKASHDVTFYVRNGRMAKYGDTVSLNIYDARKSIFKPVIETWKVKMTEELEVNHNYDLIVISVQHYQLSSAMEIITDKVGNATVLLFNNFWNEPEPMVAKLPKEQIVWGFPRAGGGFDQNGILKGTLFDNFIIGTFGIELSDRTVRIIDDFKTAGFKPIIYNDFRSYLFTHFVFNAALHPENLKSRDGIASPSEMITSRYWKNVILNYKELQPILKARNVNLKINPELKIFLLPPFLLSCAMSIVLKFFPAIKQIFTAHSNSEELKSYCRDVLKTANELNIKLPRFEANKHLYQ